MTDSPVLLTGGTGKTGTRIAERLARSGVRARIASRSGRSVSGQEGIRFDWAKPETYADALRGVTAIYLVAPANVANPLETMLPFLEKARRGDVRRFVLLSASSLEEGAPMIGRVHAWLRAEVPEWTVLRPTWFMQNFSEQQHLPTIRHEGKIYTATDDGRVPFIDADDIAAAAVETLTSPEPHNRNFLLTGPQALSYDDAADIIAGAAGRSVRHVKLSEAELAQRWTAAGLEPEYAAALAAMDTAIAGGSEDRVSDAVSTLTDAAPRSFQTFVAENAARWARLS